MTADELGAFLFDLLSEATHIVDTISVDDMPNGQRLIVSLKEGATLHVTVTPPTGD